jgi:protein PhnA
MNTPTHCPGCKSEDIYHDGNLWICPICAHEWNLDPKGAAVKEQQESGLGIRDANGNILADGDSVIVIKDLKIKGASSSIKAGAKVKSIRLVESADGHNIACKIDGVGAINLKSEFVKKA